MIEEETRLELKPDADRYGESLLYDFAKYLTTLAILALGGVLTLTQTVDRTDIKTFNIVASIIAISLAGTLAVTTANSIAHARSSGQPVPRYLHRYIAAAMALLGLGMGMFLFMWMDTLS